MTDQERIEALEGQVAMLNGSVNLLRAQVANLISPPVPVITSLPIDGHIIGAAVADHAAASYKT